MTILADLLGDLLTSALDAGSASSSRRARVIMMCALACAALVLAGATAWVLFASDDLLNKTSWGFSLVGCSVVYGAGLALGAGINLVREESDRGPTWFSFGSGALAVAVPLFWWLSR